VSAFAQRKVRRIAVLGLGSIGSRHVRNARLLGLDVIGFDPSSGAGADVPVEGFSRVDSAAAALADADAVVIASPSEQHLDDLEQAILAGCPALVEKPIGHDPDRTAALLDRAAVAQLQVGAAFNLRCRSVVQALHARAADRLGEFIWARFVSASWLPDWRPGSDYRAGYANRPESGGVVFDVIHEIDLAAYLIGSAEVASSVTCRSGRLELETEDTAEIVLRHVDGCLSSLHLSFASPVRRRAIEICGTTGMVAANLRSGEITWRDRAGDVTETETITIDPNAEYLAMLAEFVSALDQGAAPASDGLAGLAAVRLAHRARNMPPARS
jgi:predicted dehydrogenase